MLAWDIDENEVREYSPHLPAETVTWMRGQNKRGRPRRVEPPPHDALTMESLFMQQAVSTQPSYDVRAHVLSHPLVPPNPYSAELDPPKTPMPMLLSKDARASEHREFLIEAYVSLSRAFYPRLAVNSAVKFMRSTDGRRLLDAAASVFLEKSVAPQAWLVLAFEREVKKKRKQPLRPEVLYEPTLIEKGADRFHASAGEHEMFLRRTVTDPRHAEFVRGIRDLRALWERTMFELKQLTVYDEAAITQICTRYWPKGYATIYQNAAHKMRTIQNELEVRVVRGEYIWGA